MEDVPEMLYAAIGRTVIAMDRFSGRPVWRVKLPRFLGAQALDRAVEMKVRSMDETQGFHAVFLLRVTVKSGPAGLFKKRRRGHIGWLSARFPVGAGFSRRSGR